MRQNIIKHCFHMLNGCISKITLMNATVGLSGNMFVRYEREKKQKKKYVPFSTTEFEVKGKVKWLKWTGRRFKGLEMYISYNCGWISNIALFISGRCTEWKPRSWKTWKGVTKRPWMSSLLYAPRFVTQISASMSVCAHDISGSAPV